MFEVIPVVGYKHINGKVDQHYFRNWLEEINIGKASNHNKDYICLRARLEQLEESVRSSVKQINGKFVFIGELLRTIEDERLFVYRGPSEIDCKDIYKYALAHFGLKRTNTFNLIGIAREFAHLGELDKKWKEYSYSQLCEMLSMSEEERLQVTSDMTVKQIRELKNVLAHREQIPTSEYEVEDDTSESPVLQEQSIVEKLATLLSEGEQSYLWVNGEKDFNKLAEWLISKGVKLS